MTMSSMLMSMSMSVAVLRAVLVLQSEKIVQILGFLKEGVQVTLVEYAGGVISNPCW
jgi:hypothetical protein